MTDALHLWLNISLIWLAAGAIAFLSIPRCDE